MASKGRSLSFYWSTSARVVAQVSPAALHRCSASESTIRELCDPINRARSFSDRVNWSQVLFLLSSK